MTLEGVGFSLYCVVPTVNFAGVAGTDVVVVDDTHITVVTPAGLAAGAVDVSIREGTTGSTWPAGFTYE